MVDADTPTPPVRYTATTVDLAARAFATGYAHPRPPAPDQLARAATDWDREITHVLDALADAGLLRQPGDPDTPFVVNVRVDDRFRDALRLAVADAVCEAREVGFQAGVNAAKYSARRAGLQRAAATPGKMS